MPDISVLRRETPRRQLDGDYGSEASMSPFPPIIVPGYSMTLPADLKCTVPNAGYSPLSVTSFSLTRFIVLVTTRSVVAVNLPSSVVAVISAPPGEIGVTTPVASSIHATAASDDCHVTVLFVASGGVIV